MFTSIPDFNIVTTLSKLDIMENYIEFEPIEININIPEFIYSPQKNFNTEWRDSILVDQSYPLNINISGTENLYKWYFNDRELATASDGIYTLEKMGRSEMGVYKWEVTNSLVPGLTLQSEPIEIITIADISGQIKKNLETLIREGNITLLRVTPVGRFEVVQTLKFENGGYSFEKVKLDDYIIYALPEFELYPDLLGTYLGDTPFWEESDTLKLNQNETKVDIILAGIPTEPLEGNARLTGFLQEETVSEGRLLSRRRVGGAGVSVSRSTGVRKGLEENFQLYFYTYTDDEGEFAMEKLPNGRYRINIQYPGIPMDKDSFIQFDFDEDNNFIRISATVENNKIVVRDETPTGLANELVERFIIYPNPGSKVVHIRPMSLESGNRKISVTDLMGREVIGKDVSFGNGRDISLELDEEKMVFTSS
jgi:hypothetical protein